MASPIIDSIRFRVPPYMPASGSLNGKDFQDVFRVRLTLHTPKELECTRWKIHVEIMEHDDVTPDDLITGSPFPIDYCFELKPGKNYTFFIGNVDPFGKPLPMPIKDAADEAKNGRALAGGNYRLPPYAPISLSGDVGSQYEFYAVAMLIPCECEEEDELSIESLVQDSKQVGGPDIVEEIWKWLQALGGAASSVASAATSGRP